MEINKVNQLEKNFNLGEGTLRVNLYNGNMLYTYPLINMGKNNFTIATKIVYNMNYQKNAFSGRKIGFNNGWKLNFEQHLFAYEESFAIEGYEVGDYIYIDDNFCLHRFVKYKQTTKEAVYYDDSGTLLRLFLTEGQRPKIIDSNKNTYYFNNEGLMEEVTSGINKEIDKKIDYVNGRIINIYDERALTRLIQILYNDDGSIKELYISGSKIGYRFSYSNQKMVKILKYASNKTKEMISFEYSNNFLTKIINSRNLDVLKIEYNMYNQGFEIIEGTLKRILEKNYTESENYLGEDLYLGEGHFATYSGQKVKDFSLEMGYIRTRTYLTYTKAYTQLENQDKITLRYYFNKQKINISVLEQSTDNNYYTLDRPKGWIISEDGTSNIKMNGKTAQILNASNNYNYKISEEKLLEFINIFNKQEEEYSECFKISFWLNFTKQSKSDLLVALKYIINNNSKTTKVRIEDTLEDTWQKVVIPINLGLNQKTLRDVNISFSGCEKESEIIIADVMIERGSSTDIIIGDTVLDMTSTLYIDDEEKNLSPTLYVTESDIFETYKSLFYSKNTSQDTFDFVYCNKTKIKAVKKLGIKENKKITEFKIDEHDIPNYYFKLVDIINKGIWSIVEIQTRFHYDERLSKYYYETKQAIGSVKDNPSYRLIDENASIVYKFTNEDGTFRAQKDPAKVITEYTYDNYGNIELIKVYNEDDLDGEAIETIYQYEDARDEKFRESPSKIIENGISTRYVYNKNENLIDAIFSENIAKYYTYDTYHEEVVKVEIVDLLTNQTKEENNIKYYDDQSTKSISGKDGNIYGFGYNDFATIQSVYKDYNLIEETKQIKDIGTNTYQKTIYQDKLRPSLSSATYNSYDSIVKEETAGEGTFYSYEDNKISTYAKRLTKIIDHKAKDYYEIKYEDKNIVTSSEVTINDSLKIIKYSNNVIAYQKQNEDAISQEIINDNSLEPKLQEIKYRGNNEAYEDFCSQYEYDKLGRLKKRIGDATVYNKGSEQEASISLNKEIDYEKGTNLPNKLQYVVLAKSNGKEDNATFSYTSSYKTVDGVFTSNITSIKEEGTRYIENPKDDTLFAKDKLTTRTYQYQYDSLNQLIEEKNSSLGNFEYQYTNQGALTKVIKNGKITKEYTYEKDKLTSININNTRKPILYDNYGNTIKIGNVYISYDANNLMQNYDSGNNKYYYYYNYQGVRYKKKLNYELINYEINYLLNGNTILGEDWLDNNNNITHKIRYFYNEDGICGIRYDGYNFTLVKDSQGNVSKVMYKGKIIGEYIYDAWGNHTVEEISVTNQRDQFVLHNNPFRYKGYYYDVETGLAMVGQRYYSPELGRFIQLAEVSTLNPSSINGLNLYSYANNNPIGIAYNSPIVGGLSSGGMIGSTSGTLGNIVGSGSVVGGSKVSGFGSLSGSSFGSINWPKANSVLMTHYTTSLIENAFIGAFFGNISYTVTTQLNDSEMFYSYSNIGNGGYSAGVGMNLGNWYGISAYVSSNLGFGTSMQLTPWITYGAEISLQDGISFSFGTISGNTTQEITANVGWGTIAGAYLVCAGIAAIPMPGARALAGAAACVILLIDIFN